MVRMELQERGLLRKLLSMSPISIEYARCSTRRWDHTAHHQSLLDLGVSEARICTDHGLTSTMRARP